MTREEVAKVLARVQLGDNRQVDVAVLAAWVREIGDLDFADAVEAVELHRRETPVWLMTAHVRAGVRRVQARREREARVSQPKAITGNVITLDREKFERETEAFIAQYRAERAAKGAGS